MKVLFYGDSITDAGHTTTGDLLGSGYVNETAKMLANRNLQFINSGIGGNRVRDLLARFDNDLAALNPDIVVLLIGINDVWRKYDANDGISHADFKKQYIQLVKSIKELDTKLIIMEPFLIETPDKLSYREDLNPKIDIIREIAKSYADEYLALDGYFAELTVQYGQEVLSLDGVHLTENGAKKLAEKLEKTIQKFL